jgi:hypothetical protein
LTSAWSCPVPITDIACVVVGPCGRWPQSCTPNLRGLAAAPRDGPRLSTRPLPASPAEARRTPPEAGRKPGHEVAEALRCPSWRSEPSNAPTRRDLRDRQCRPARRWADSARERLTPGGAAQMIGNLGNDARIGKHVYSHPPMGRERGPDRSGRPHGQIRHIRNRPPRAQPSRTARHGF